MSAAQLLDDSTLIDAVRDGDEAAFEVLYRRYNPIAENRIRRDLYGTTLEPSDLTHQAWADIVQGIRGGSQIDNLPAYLKTVIQRNLYAHQNSRRTDSLEHLIDDGHTPAAVKIAGAERSFYDQSLELITSSLHADSRPKPRRQALRESAVIIRDMYGFDTPLHPIDNSTRRRIVATIQQPELYEELTSAIKAQIALTSKASIPPPYDPAIAALFTGWPVADLEELLILPTRELLCLVEASVCFLPKPSEPDRRVLRAELAALSSRPGWTKTIRALEKAWVAEWCDATASCDRSSDPVVAEAERVSAASLWEQAAAAAVVFPGQPLGRTITTVADVHRRIARIAR